jgi:transcriptional regulator GlxA family with amidase domain
VAFSAFEVANKRSGETLYDLHALSESGGLLRSSFGMDVSTEAIGDGEFDTILVGVGCSTVVELADEISGWTAAGAVETCQRFPTRWVENS